MLPLAPLLEARAGALVLAISALALAFKAAYPKAKSEAGWVKERLAEMEAHLEALRLAAAYVESSSSEERVHPLLLRLVPIKRRPLPSSQVEMVDPSGPPGRDYVPSARADGSVPLLAPAGPSSSTA